MKKIFIVPLIMALIVFGVVGCGNAPSNDVPPNSNGRENADNTPQGNRDITKIGLGSVTSIDSSKEAEGEEGPKAQVDTIMATVAFDRDDKVADVTIDTSQTNVEFDSEGKLVTDKEGEFKTKVELGYDYDMKRVSDIDKEWFEQIAELEKWMIGKTVDEIRAMKVKERDPSHTHVPDEPELTSTVTITVGEYIRAVEKAHENAVEIDAKSQALGQEHKISIKDSEKNFNY